MKERNLVGEESLFKIWNAIKIYYSVELEFGAIDKTGYSMVWTVFLLSFLSFLFLIAVFIDGARRVIGNMHDFATGEESDSCDDNILMTDKEI